MALKYRQTFYVTGNSEFPLDMLRYDRCSPYDTEDAATIRQSFVLDLNTPRRVYRVRLMRYCEGKLAEPTYGRWSSFLWGVDPASVTMEKLP